MTASRWAAIYAAAAAFVVAVFATILIIAPRKDGALNWTGQIVEGFWMAWTLPVALFFATIASLLILFTILAIRFPETPRIGILRIETTRGDRLFISLLGTGFIQLGWLFFMGAPLWGALILSLVWWAAVFRWV